GGASAVIRPWLGVRGESLSADAARSLGLDRPQGLVITDVYGGGPGDRAGLETGDIITAVDGAEVNDQGGLNFRVGTREPGSAVEVTVLRDGQPRTLRARVERLPGEADVERAVTLSRGVFAGARVLALNPALADSLGGNPFASGVIVAGVERGGYAQRTGLRGGDIILLLNGRQVTAVDQLAAVPPGVEVTIERRGQRLTGVVR
ncbi:MAG: PDZ domain-containing protein, partial [Brevundimonas sp.]